MKVEILGKFYDNHSLSIVNRNLTIELAKLQNDEFKVFITPLDGFKPEHKIAKEDIKILKSLQNIESEADIQIRHSYPPLWRWPLDKKTKIAFIQPWEYSRVPMEWQYKFETFADAVIVPSRWVADRYVDGGLQPEKSFIVPNGYNPNIFNMDRNVQSQYLPKNGKLTFCYVGCGQYRKGIDILLNAWASTHVKADKVRLIIKDTPQIYGDGKVLEEITKLQFKTGCAEIIYVDDILSDEEMAAIYKNSNFIVHPFRGEGFGMHLQEAIACGCLPIVTASGGPSDFLNTECAIILATKQVHIDMSSPNVMAMKPGDSLSMMHTHGWVLEPDIDDLKRFLRDMYRFGNDNKEKFFEMTNKAKLTTWEDAAKNLLDDLKMIHSRESVQRHKWGI